MTFCRPHPRKLAFDTEAVPQYRRFVTHEITKDELMLVLRDMADVHDLVGFLDWGFWRRDGYVLPWEREPQGNGAAGATAGQGGTR